MDENKLTAEEKLLSAAVGGILSADESGMKFHFNIKRENEILNTCCYNYSAVDTGSIFSIGLDMKICCKFCQHLIKIEDIDGLPAYDCYYALNAFTF